MKLQSILMGQGLYDFTNKTISWLDDQSKV